MGVYDISERQHVQLQRRRDDFFSLMAYLREQDLFFSLNHMFSGLTGQRTLADYELFELHFPAVETRNGQLLASLNEAAAEYAERLAMAAVAGSDAHSLSSLGSTSTEVLRARDVREFLIGLRHGRGMACGESGGYGKLTRAVFEIAGAMMQERKWTLAISPVAVFIPLVTLTCWLREIAFGQRWILRTGNPLRQTTIVARALGLPRRDSSRCSALVSRDNKSNVEAILDAADTACPRHERSGMVST